MAYSLRTLDQQHTVLLQHAVTTIGSNPTSTVPIHPGFGLAPEQFSIRLAAEGTPWLEDRTGMASTLINGRPVQQQQLVHGDIISAGQLALVFMGEEVQPRQPTGTQAVPPPQPHYNTAAVPQPQQHYATASVPQPQQHYATASVPQPQQHYATASVPQPQPHYNTAAVPQPQEAPVPSIPAIPTVPHAVVTTVVEGLVPPPLEMAPPQPLSGLKILTKLAPETVESARELEANIRQNKSAGLLIGGGLLGLVGAAFFGAIKYWHLALPMLPSWLGGTSATQ
jgi:hypothetical protein